MKVESISGLRMQLERDKGLNRKECLCESGGHECVILFSSKEMHKYIPRAHKVGFIQSLPVNGKPGNEGKE